MFMTSVINLKANGVNGYFVGSLPNFEGTVWNWMLKIYDNCLVKKKEHGRKQQMNWHEKKNNLLQY